MSEAAPTPDRMRPLETIRGVRALIANPDDTAQVFRVIRAAGGRHFGRLLRRVQADPVGRRILAERRSLLPALADRDALRDLPEGSLGRSYADFVDAEQISAQGLADASLDQDPRASAYGEDGRVLGERLRDMHDLWHVVTGYGRDLIGEAALLAFSYAQTRNRGIGVLVAVGLWKLSRAGADEAVATIRGGYRRGRAAALLPAADWEALLPLPLDEVRRRLGVDPPGRYEAMRSEGAPALASS